MEAPRLRLIRAEDNMEEESGSESTSGGDLEEEVAQLVYKVVDETESPQADSPNTSTQTETMHQQSRRAASLYMALFQGEHSDMLVLGPGPNSVYTASIVFPQIARSSGYQLTYVAISLKMIILAVICVVVQTFLVCALWKAALYLPTQSGVPHMCTYGQDTEIGLPKGPLGMTIDRHKSNIESNYNMLIIRNTLWQVMQSVNITNPAIGPVDFGVESITCRAACVFAFLVSIMGEMQGMWGMAQFLLRSPTLRSRNQDHAEQWISFDQPDEATKKLMLALGKKDIDFVSFKMAGMPFRWKILWAWPVLIVRLVINLLLGWVGFRFLLNSGGVIDLILNALALFFIVELDLLMFNTFAKDMTRDIMGRLEPYRIQTQPSVIEALMRKNMRKQKTYNVWDLLWRTVKFSRTTLSVLLIMYGLFMFYFYRSCYMEVAPFSTSPIINPYFSSSHIWRFSWEFLAGRWRSKNITQRSMLHGPSNITLCAPSGNGAEIVGCGLPTPWTGS